MRTIYEKQLFQFQFLPPLSTGVNSYCKDLAPLSFKNGPGRQPSKNNLLLKEDIFFF